MPLCSYVLAALLSTAAPPHWQPLGEPGSGGWITAISISPHDSRRLLLCGDMLGIGLSEDRGEHWQPTFGLRSWEIGDCTWHPTNPDLVWAGTVSGPYLSSDGGRHWSERREGLPAVSGGQYTAPIEKILFDPTDTEHLLAFGGSSRGWQSPGAPLWGVVWESRDGGGHWRRLSRLDGNIVGATYGGAGATVLYAAVRGRGIFASADGGATWQERSAGLPQREVERIVADPRAAETLLCCLSPAKVAGQALCLAGGVCRSTDGGRSWQALPGLPAKRAADPNFTSGFKGLALCAANPEVLVCANEPWDVNAIFGSTDGGQHWQALADKSKVDVAYFAGLNCTVMAIDPRDPQCFYGAGSEYLVGSRDGGRTWRDLTAERHGDGWRGRGYSGLCATNVKWDPFTPGRLFILAMDAGKLWESRDNGGSWTFRGADPWPWGGGDDITFARDGRVYAATGQFGGNGSILRTTDGKAWKALSGPEHGLPKFEGQGAAESVYCLPDDSAQVWCCWGGRLYHSADGGQKFAVVPGPAGVSRLAADPRQPKRFLVSGQPTCYLTEDGAAFTPIGGPKVAGKARCDSLGRFYVTAWRGPRAGIWRYADGQWARIWDSYYVHDLAPDPSDPHRLVAIEHDHPFHDVCAARGVWLSADDGKSWSPANEGLPMTRLEAVGINPADPEDLIVGSHGGGFYRARWSKDYVPTGTASYASTPADAKFAAYVAPPPPPPVHLALANGDMSAGTDLPTGWTDHWGDVTAARDTKIFRSAPASLRVDSKGGTGQFFQMMDAPGGLKLRVGGAIKCAGGAKAQCAVQAFDEGFTQNQFFQLQFVQGDADWTSFSKDLTLPIWTRRFNVQLWVSGQGQAWLDDVTLEVLHP